MKKLTRILVKIVMGGISTAAVTLLLVSYWSTDLRADETDAKNILKAMSDYIESQEALSFEYDSILEIVTTDGQKLGLASSGSVILKRPDKIRATRSSGFADVEIFFNGKTLTLLGKDLNIYSQIELPGTIDHLVNELKDTYNRPLPAADLLLSNSYEEMMLDVVDVKDLGSGVIGGVECDHLAFRKKEVDWQIWIAHGDHPYPARYVITSTFIDGGPQYSIQTRNWKTGNKVPSKGFTFLNPTMADNVDLKDLEGTDHLPGHFKIGGAK
ncbi:DUF2092 domain-containing protein [Desulfogranum marinum]|uniref:DUF2092 domain-containing protein n=1 Tax=Desulfogranum marinum TaxID=453220 RepID=UPI001962942C|nr:DUF2092 domain-containing protein [Desulfogranum marinum]MBM9513704.1 DUF2092 domain-containing protein [Desulfogranum marinum]